MSEPVLVRDGVIRQTATGSVLSGSRCRGCGETHFPAPTICFACLGEDLEPVELSAVGKLFAFTTVHMKTAHFDPPYQVGYVDLPEGVRIFTQLRTNDGASLRIGVTMAVEIGPLWTDDDGTPVVGYRFHPAQ